MTKRHSGLRGPHDPPLSPSRIVGVGETKTGGFRRIEGIEGRRNPSSKKIIANLAHDIERKTEEILGKLEANDKKYTREKAIEEFDTIILRVKSELERLQIPTGSLDTKIDELRKQISGE